MTDFIDRRDDLPELEAGEYLLFDEVARMLETCDAVDEVVTTLRARHAFPLR